MEPEEMSKAQLLKYIDTIEKENFDLVAKVIELINRIAWDDDGTYTFNDGDRWSRFEPEQEDVTDE